MLSVNLRCTAAVYVAMALCQWNFMPWYVLPCVIVGVFSRWAFDIHTRTHYRGQYPWLEEFMPLLLSPLGVGLSEQRLVHQRHHAHLHDDADPDAVFYRRSPAIALLLCWWHPEITFFRTMPQMDRTAWVRVGLRLVLFVTLYLIAGANFLLWYFLPLRVVFAIAQFVFTWVLHHREKTPTINLNLPHCTALLFGEVGWRELRQHVAHHRH